MLLIPLFMITIGVYIHEIPNVLEKQIELNGRDMFYVPIRILGTNIDVSSPWGILLVYILGTLLVGVSCFIWQDIGLGFILCFGPLVQKAWLLP